MSKKTENKELTSKNEEEESSLSTLRKFHLDHIEKFGVYWNTHSLVTIQRQTLSRIIYYDKLYREIVGIPGVILEFGVQWGATLSQLIALRGIYEPYNYSRHIYGFDTFEGFVNTSQDKDGKHLSDGDYEVYKGYEDELEKVLLLHESMCPLSHKKKFDLIKGDASITSREWIENHPQAIVSMVIFDMDLYKPTKDVLEIILPRLTKGSILVFDELNDPNFPGETEALDEVLSLNKIKLNHFSHQPNCAWAVWGE